jgi:hypothetical protein
MRWAGHVPCIKMTRKIYDILFRRSGRPKHGWGDNTKIDIEEIKGKSVEWAQIVQDMVQWLNLVNMAIKLRVVQ